MPGTTAQCQDQRPELKTKQIDARVHEGFSTENIWMIVEDRDSLARPSAALSAWQISGTNGIRFPTKE